MDLADTLVQMKSPPNGLRYRVLTGPDDAEFCRRVSEALESGYRLHAGPSMAAGPDGMRIAQAIVWDDDNSIQLPVI